MQKIPLISFINYFIIKEIKLWKVKEMAEIIVPESPPERNGELASTPEDIIEAKIIALLKVYPVLSASMIQAGLGPSLSASLWRPVLTKMLEAGTLIQWDQSASDERGSAGAGVVRTRPYPCIARSAASSPEAASR